MNICGKLCETGEVVTFTTADGKITGSRHGAENDALGGPDVWLSPGFCDLQLNGYGGHDFNHRMWGDGKEVSNEIVPIFEKAAHAGTAMLCPTITTSSHEAMK